MAYDTIKTEKRGAVALITLDRPDALNALNAQLVDELVDAVQGFDKDDAIGCMVITGSEKAFAAGADIKEMQPKSYMDAYKEDLFEKAGRIAEARKPIIAAVSG